MKRSACILSLSALVAVAACSDDEETTTAPTTTSTTGGMGGDAGGTAEGGGGADATGGGGATASGGGGSTAEGGAGGAPAGAVVLNEIEASADDGATPDADWIEMYNPGGAAIDVSGYCFRDDSEEPDHVFEIPAGTTIAPGGYLTFVQDAPDSFTFGLGAGGDEVHLYDGCTVDTGTMTVTFGNLVDETTWVSQGDGSWGRLPNGTGAFQDLATASFGAENM